MQIGIGGYSFHKLLEAGKQDIFQYIVDCKRLGATQLDPWNAQLVPICEGDTREPVAGIAQDSNLTGEEKAYLIRVREAAQAAQMPFGCIAVDDAHIYEPTETMRQANARRANRWLEAARILGAPQVRIDCGGPEDMTEEIFSIIVEGYNVLIPKAHAMGIEILIENHWGPSCIPVHVERIVQSINGLGLLFDTENWADGLREEGLARCAHLARATHIKTFQFDDESVRKTVNAIRKLFTTGFRGCWGIESCPEDLEEYAAAENTIALVRKTLAECGYNA